MNQKKIANLGLFAAVAIIFGYVESLIPFFAGIPGMKLGLANLAVLFILEKYTWKEAALVSAVRIIVIGFMFGNLFSILYSLAGAALSLTVMTFMKKKSGFSILGISVAGGVSHNIGQLIIAGADHDDFRADLLCTGVVDIRSDHRTSYWHTYRRSIKTY